MAGIDVNVNGLPYGVDLIIPGKYNAEAEEAFGKIVPYDRGLDQHKSFIEIVPGDEGVR